MTAVDDSLLVALRPPVLAQFVGQDTQRMRLAIACQAARERGEPVDHLLLSGAPGLGKTTLANIVAAEMRTKIVSTSGPALEKSADLVGLLTSLNKGDVFFIDEIHRLSHVLAEFIYPAMEDFKIDILLGEGAAAQAFRAPIQPFTLIGATTSKGMLAGAMRARFGFTFDLKYYGQRDMAAIVGRSAGVLGLSIEDTAIEEIARRSRGTPRTANRLLRRVRDYAQVGTISRVGVDLVDEALELEGVDDLGLDEMDRNYLLTLIGPYQGGPAGVAAIAATMQQDVQTLVETIEPFLLHEGFILRTQGGRRAAPRAYEHLLGSTAVAA